MILDAAVQELVADLTAELGDDNTIGFAVGGSYARGEASPYSDIDFSRFVRNPITGYARHYYLYRRNFVIEVANIPIEPAWQDLTKPSQAIWFVPALRQLLILQDKTGELKRLQQAAQDFEWSPLQDAANHYASYLLHERVETVRKLVGKLKGLRLELEVQRPVSLLTDILTHLVAVQRGVLIKTGDTYYRQVQETVGLDSDWTNFHLRALGVESNLAVSWSERAIASLHLYLETARLFQDILRQEDQEVVGYTVQFIKDFISYNLEKR